MSPRWKHRLRRAFVVLIATYVVLCLVVRLGYRSLLYPAPPAVEWQLDASDRAAGALVLDLVASDGVPVEAALFPAPSNAKTIVYLHGNGETAAGSLDLARAIRARGLGVALVEYRGYGHRRDTSPDEEGLYRDATAVLDELAHRGVQRDAILLWGTSLGTGLATELATRGRASALILTSPYTSIPALAQRILPFLPMSLLIGDHFDNLAKAPSLSLPTLVIHGTADALIPFAIGSELAATIPGAHLLPIPEGGHNDLLCRARTAILDAVVELTL